MATSSTQTKRRYAKRAGSAYRKKLIISMWYNNPGRTMGQIADAFNVSYSTVNHAIHKHLEMNDEVYKALEEANQRRSIPYSQAVVTRAWMAIQRWYPSIKTKKQLKKLTFGSDIDNNVYISKACETLIIEAQELL